MLLLSLFLGLSACGGGESSSTETKEETETPVDATDNAEEMIQEENQNELDSGSMNTEEPATDESNEEEATEE